ncbi:xyloglucan endotransglucosylase/hydrolase protein 31 [Selaginella moellendorffii]|uniref:xyloglucan endotransglucosylase/hydrolase protein 31 n=1 Tax=Selaginella moellendorffii TaxID=88036 RepID=UPI000D1CEDEB|nr:xyloglucan endotransglucosylase/hydrolase protein 31 [Selaginella moellendorffii]|eukprot:XP_024534909.1 xyloglucan endotransglucosylase/hydrolase protein 31 [Selaginella moellendorffii]
MEKVPDLHKTEELSAIAVDYCPEVCQHFPEQREISVTFDERGGARWRSTRRFSSGTFSAKIKTPSGNTSGLNSSFYLSTLEGPRDQDEIDFEFLGKDKGTVQTNFYTHGTGGREVIHDLGFDSSQEFHEYTIKWEPDRIEWLVDGKSIRVAEKKKKKVNEGLWAGPYIGCDVPYVCVYKDVFVPCH